MRGLRLAFLLLSGFHLGYFNLIPAYKIPASIETVIQRNEYKSNSKFIKAAYVSAGAVNHVEGSLQQIHPLSLCNDKISKQYGKIFVVKLEGDWAINTEDPYCRSAAEKARLAIEMGANAVILVVTDREQESLDELSAVSPPFSRPVTIIDDESEENKLLAVLTSGHSAYARISPSQNTEPPGLSEQELQLIAHRERLTYTGVGVIFGLIIVLLIIGVAVLWRLRNIKHQDLDANRRSVIERVGSLKYSHRRLARLESCTICLEHFSVNENVRVLPCKHQFHISCIDPWLLKHDTCPICCGNVQSMLRSDKPPRSRTIHRSKKSVISRDPRLKDLSSNPDYLLHKLEKLRKHRLNHNEHGEMIPMLNINKTRNLPKENQFIGQHCQGCPQEQADISCLGSVTLNSIRSSLSSIHYNDHPNPRLTSTPKNENIVQRDPDGHRPLPCKQKSILNQISRPQFSHEL